MKKRKSARKSKTRKRLKSTGRGRKTQTTEQRNALRRVYLGVALIVVLTGIAYFPALKADYIWDDTGVYENPILEDDNGIWRLWLTPRLNFYERHYWPLTYTTFWIERRICSIQPFGYHLVNLLLHILNALLLWRLLKMLGMPYGYLASLIFALHPVHVESVAWVVERKDVLSGMFYLLAFITYLRFERDRNGGMYILAIALFVCAMFSKGVAVSFPFALGIAIWWRNGRLVRRDTMRLLPFFAIAGLLAIFDVAVCYTPQITFHSGLSLIERLLLATRSLWFYGEKMILPIPLMAIYPQWEIDAREVILYIYPIALVTTFVSLWVLRQRISRGPFAAVLFFCITLGPTLGLIDYAFMYYTYVADRFQYLASIGLIVLATGILYKLIARSGASQQIGYGLIVAICATLAVLTFQHSGTFKNRETLFRHTADNNPGAWAAWNNLGTFAFQRGELYKAKQLIEKSLEAWSEFPKANTNMGAVYVKLKEYDRAIEYCDRALKVKPDSLQALNNKGLALMNLKRHDEAIECLMKAVEVKKDDLVACRTLARIYEERNDYAEAVKWRKKVLEANPSEAEAHYELANTYYNMKAYDKAKEHYTAALELQPDHWMALNNYGYCMFDQGNLEEARRLFEKALEINPRFTKALNNMAVASIKLKQYDRAIEYCNRALEEKPGYFQALNNKSHALKQAKRFKEAVVSYTQTIALRKRGAGAHISLAGLHFDLANCYYALKDYDHALEHFTVTLRLNPEHKEARSSIEGIRTLQK